MHAIRIETEESKGNFKMPRWFQFMDSWFQPIRQLNRKHSPRMRKHLLSLDEHDRYLRFGFVASDEHIERYVADIPFDHDCVLGVYNWRLQLLGLAHVAYSVDRDLAACAEFGVSVLPGARGRGLGHRLFARAAIHARNEGVQLMFIHALSENTAMLNIARDAGAVIEQEAGESDAYLRLPPATFDTRLSEMVEEQLALTDYRLKREAQRFLALLSELQARRQGSVTEQGDH